MKMSLHLSVKPSKKRAESQTAKLQKGDGMNAIVGVKLKEARREKMNENEFELNGRWYAARDTDGICDGCAFEGDKSGCDSTPHALPDAQTGETSFTSKSRNRKAHPERYRFTRNFDILIACVDSRKSRKEIFQTLPKKDGPYVLDGGVLATCGQVIIGNGSKELPYPYEELPTLIDTKVKEQNLPSCSLAESLSVQELFVNQWLATAELELCWRLFRKGGLDYRGFYINLDTGRMNPVPID